MITELSKETSAILLDEAIEKYLEGRSPETEKDWVGIMLYVSCQFVSHIRFRACHILNHDWGNPVSNVGIEKALAFASEMDDLKRRERIVVVLIELKPDVSAFARLGVTVN